MGSGEPNRPRSRTCCRCRPRSTAARPRSASRRASEWVNRSFAEVAGDGPLALAGPDRPRRRQGRQGLDPRQHPPRVDLLRLRRALGRRHRRADLPDQLPRGVPVRAGELRRQGRRRRGRRADGEDPRGPRPAAAARARDPDDRLQRRRDLLDDLAARGAAATPPSGRRAGSRSPRRTSAPSSTRRARPARRRAASSATATTGRCSTWSTRPA